MARKGIITARRLAIGACIVMFLVLSGGFFLEYLTIPFWQMDFVAADAYCDIDQYNAIEKCNVEFQSPEWILKKREWERAQQQDTQSIHPNSHEPL